jgi:hypothetical protein
MIVFATASFERAGLTPYPQDAIFFAQFRQFQKLTKKYTGNYNVAKRLIIMMLLGNYAIL